MQEKSIVFDSVRFFDRSSEELVHIEGACQIKDPTMIPAKGDFVRFGPAEREFIVLDRHFHYLHGACSVLVNIQPAGRENGG